MTHPNPIPRFDTINEYHRYWSRTVPVLSINPRFLHIALDICNVCNLRCRFCYLVLPGVRSKPIFLTGEDIQRQLGPLLPYTRRLCLSCGFEPLVSPCFTEILSMLAPYHIPQLDLVTNAMLLSEDKIDAIIKSGVQTLRFSLDSSDKATYESIRTGAHFETVIGNIKRLTQRKRELGSQTPSLAMIVVLMQSNLHQLKDLLDLAIELDVASVTMQHLIPFAGLHMESEVITEKDAARFDPLISTLREHAEKNRIFFSAPSPFLAGQHGVEGWSYQIRSKIKDLYQAVMKTQPPGAPNLRDITYGTINHALRILRKANYPAHSFCKNPFNLMIITPEGRAKACPYLDDPWISVFDNQKPLTEAFLGAKHQALRQIMIDGGPYPAPCLNCPDCRLSNARNRI